MGTYLAVTSHFVVRIPTNGEREPMNGKWIRVDVNRVT